MKTKILFIAFVLISTNLFAGVSVDIDYGIIYHDKDFSIRVGNDRHCDDGRYRNRHRRYERERGHWELREREVWVPGFWKRSSNGSQYWVEGYYKIVYKKVWVRDW
jgi:hypothetical protein